MCRRGEGRAQRHLRSHRLGQIEFGITETDCSFSFVDRSGVLFTYAVESYGCAVDREREVFADYYNATMNDALVAADVYPTILRLRGQRC